MRQNLKWQQLKNGFNFLAPIAVEVLLCRGSAQKIASPVRLRSGGTNSGKSS